MLETVKRLADKLIEAEISIPNLLEKVAGKADSLKELWGVAKEHVCSFLPPVLFALILVALSLVETFVGKKLLGLQKVLICAAFGYIVGTAYIQPFLATVLPLDKMIVGAAVALIAACLCRPIYFCGYIGVIGYFVYFLMMNGCPVESTKGDKLIAVIAAAAIIVFCLIFRKIVEIAGTSAVGAVFTYLAVKNVVPYLADGRTLNELLGDYKKIVMIAFLAVLFIFGFVVQYRRRRRW